MYSDRGGDDQEEDTGNRSDIYVYADQKRRVRDTSACLKVSASNLDYSHEALEHVNLPVDGVLLWFLTC
ncbi:hypothetical protein N7535_004100 [Penicillium sp. DV-2018c]|nr:hypothetical protein N7461_000194 [Penicillium sp. DV-2018c]KAJ5577174.1 hypothetical protein N7535_004100 [Penicillium sp. DV-2018c]